MIDKERMYELCTVNDHLIPDGFYRSAYIVLKTLKLNAAYG